jgi:hypothetical protein
LTAIQPCQRPQIVKGGKYKARRQDSGHRRRLSLRYLRGTQRSVQ